MYESKLSRKEATENLLKYQVWLTGQTEWQ